MNKATFVKSILIDEDGYDVFLSVYKHENGGLFAIDSSYLEQAFDFDVYPTIPDPFGNAVKEKSSVMLTGN